MRFNRVRSAWLAVPLIALTAAACSKTNVSRIDPGAVTDLSGRWNDTDSRLVAAALIDQSLNGVWLDRYADANGGATPPVIVGEFRNRSTEHIPVQTFVGDLERAFVNSGAVTLVAPLQRLAIANRGEAAMRCIRAVKSLRALEGSSLEAVALYTDPDRDAPFVRHADHAVRLASGSAPGAAVAAYLDIEGVVAGLREIGADSVWPGWGFVAEDPVFVDRLAEEGIIFLGPPASAMRELGDKITSKKLAEKAGVPVTKWSGGPLVDEKDALAHAERIGFPVVLKATAGGGGRGIRMVHRAEEVAEAYRSATAEAAAAFGNGTLFVGGLIGHGLDGGIATGRHHQCGGQRAQLHPDARGEVMPAGRVRQVERQHQYVSTSFTRVAVHIRPTTLSRAACQSKVACTPCGPEISMRGRGR